MLSGGGFICVEYVDVVKSSSYGKVLSNPFS
jgi:hypothetical protein